MRRRHEEIPDERGLDRLAVEEAPPANRNDGRLPGEERANQTAFLGREDEFTSPALCAGDVSFLVDSFAVDFPIIRNRETVGLGVYIEKKVFNLNGQF